MNQAKTTCAIIAALVGLSAMPQQGATAPAGYPYTNINTWGDFKTDALWAGVWYSGIVERCRMVGTNQFLNIYLEYDEELNEIWTTNSALDVIEQVVVQAGMATSIVTITDAFAYVYAVTSVTPQQVAVTVTNCFGPFGYSWSNAYGSGYGTAQAPLSVSMVTNLGGLYNRLAPFFVKTDVLGTNTDLSTYIATAGIPACTSTMPWSIGYAEASRPATVVVGVTFADVVFDANNFEDGTLNGRYSHSRTSVRSDGYQKEPHGFGEDSNPRMTWARTNDVPTNVPGPCWTINSNYYNVRDKKWPYGTNWVDTTNYPSTGTVVMATNWVNDDGGVFTNSGSGSSVDYAWARSLFHWPQIINTDLRAWLRPAPNVLPAILYTRSPANTGAYASLTVRARGFGMTPTWGWLNNADETVSVSGPLTPMTNRITAVSQLDVSGTPLLGDAISVVWTNADTFGYITHRFNARNAKERIDALLPLSWTWSGDRTITWTNTPNTNTVVIGNMATNNLKYIDVYVKTQLVASVDASTNEAYSIDCGTRGDLLNTIVILRWTTDW